jgi:hypothetical protein
MRKIKANGLKFNNKPMDRGPRFVVAFHGTDVPEKAKETLLRLFDINEPLADVALSANPAVICRDLDQQTAMDYVKKLKGCGDFRVWLESAAGRLKQHMNLKQKSETAPAPNIYLRKR